MKDKIEISMKATGVETYADDYREIQVTVSGTTAESVLNNFTLADIVEHYGKAEISAYMRKIKTQPLKP